MKKLFIFLFLISPFPGQAQEFFSFTSKNDGVYVYSPQVHDLGKRGFVLKFLEFKNGAGYLMNFVVFGNDHAERFRTAIELPKEDGIVSSIAGILSDDEHYYFVFKTGRLSFEIRAYSDSGELLKKNVFSFPDEKIKGITAEFLLQESLSVSSQNLFFTIRAAQKYGEVIQYEDFVVSLSKIELGLQKVIQIKNPITWPDNGNPYPYRWKFAGASGDRLFFSCPMLHSDKKFKPSKPVSLAIMELDQSGQIINMFNYEPDIARNFLSATPEYKILMEPDAKTWYLLSLYESSPVEKFHPQNVRKPEGFFVSSFDSQGTPINTQLFPISAKESGNNTKGKLMFSPDNKFIWSSWEIKSGSMNFESPDENFKVLNKDLSIESESVQTFAFPTSQIWQKQKEKYNRYDEEVINALDIMMKKKFSRVKPYHTGAGVILMGFDIGSAPLSEKIKKLVLYKKFRK